MQEALRQVRCSLGPDAAVLQTREVPRGVIQWLAGSRQVEVLASNDVNVPSRLPAEVAAHKAALAAPDAEADHDDDDDRPTGFRIPPVDGRDYRTRFREGLRAEGSGLRSLVEELARVQVASEELPLEVAAPRVQPRRVERPLVKAGPEPNVASRQTREISELSPATSPTITAARQCLLEAGIEAAIADEMLAGITREPQRRRGDDLDSLLARLQQRIAAEIRVGEPLHVTAGRQRVVALVGPTGVGKTTAVAKLAHAFRRKERRRVGLIAMNANSAASGRSLRSLVGSLDLPVEFAADRRELHAALDRLHNCDLVLLDTPGRNPADDTQMRRLRRLLEAADAHDVLLALSSVASTASLLTAAEQFTTAGATALLLTKLDEAAELGGLLALLRRHDLPLSYWTDGQSISGGLAAADANRLAQRILLGRTGDVAASATAPARRESDLDRPRRRKV